MIRSIIRFSAQNRVLVLLVTAVAVGYGIWTLRHIPVDAIPDLSDTQVIVYSRWDRSPDIVEDQVTYPVVTALLGAPKVKTILKAICWSRRERSWARRSRSWRRSICMACSPIACCSTRMP